MFGALLSCPVFAATTATCNQTVIQALAPSNTLITAAAPAFANTTSGSTPYCRISAQITTSKPKNDFIHFEVDLPDSSFWNNRFQFHGNGGWGGELSSIVSASKYQSDLQSGYAMAATDMGHSAVTGPDGLELANASWALNNLPAVKDFAYRAVHKATVSAKTIISAYYANPSYHSYFFGCSTGGREGLVEAQKYPADFDGIVAGDSVIGDPFVGFNWNAQNFLQPDAYIDPAAITLVNQAVINACGDPTGPAQGLVLNPASCNFDPSVLECSSGPNSNCLTPQQAAAFNAIYQGAVDTKGKQLYPGYSKSDPGNDATPFDGGISWENWITGCSQITVQCVPPLFDAAEPWGPYFVAGDTAPSQWIFQDQFLQNFVYGDPTYDSRTFGAFDTTTGKYTDQKALNKATSKSKRWGGDGMNTNLKSFVKLNHKLLMYHGWSDPAISPFQSVNYFTGVQSVLGASTTNNVRLFMVPGMDHCGDGPGPNVFDVLTPLTAWVENNTPPDGIIAQHYFDNDPDQTVDRSMPLCSYPELATYVGPPGGPNNAYNLASNWVCH
jgi:feruloyl esterase